MRDYLNQLPETARDVKLNLIKQLEQDDEAWSQQERYAIMYALLLALPKKPQLLWLCEQLGPHLSEEMISAAKIAVNTMAMNNIYYRFLHLANRPELSAQPAGLRMQQMAKQPVSKALFEAMSLAISALSGCGMCIQAHITTLKRDTKADIAILDIVRMAAVVNAFAALEMPAVVTSPSATAMQSTAL